MTGEFDAGFLAVRHFFAKPKVEYLHCSFAVHDVAWLEVVVDDFFLEFEEVGDSGEKLLDDAPSLLLLETLVLAQVD